jgi:Domain of unknown function (DUF4253)
MRVRDWIGAIRRHSASLREPPEAPEIARWTKALSDFGYPYDLVSAARAEDALASAQTAGRQAGFVPVILVPGHWESKRMPPNKRVLLAQEMSHEAFDAAYGQQFLVDGLLAMYDDLEIDPDNPDPDEFGRLQPIESVACSSGLSIVKRWDRVAIVRVPAASAEELPAYFEWGGWNAVPEAQKIVAVARHWRKAYGAELVAIGPDSLEFTVRRQPQDHSAAVALLKEQYVFSSDSFVEFGRKYLEEAAARLRTGSFWVFRWD